MADRWAADGHEVEVLTAFPHHPTGVIPPEYAGRKFQREKRNGVDVTRTYVYVAPNKGIVKRGLSYFSWMFSAMTLGAARAKRPDVMVATSPQFLCAVAGLVVARLKRVPFVLEVRDLWPDSILAVGALKEGFAVRVLRRIERFLYKQADSIVIVSPGFTPHMRAHGVDHKMNLLPNGVDLVRFSPGEPSRDVYAENGIRGPVKILYSGTVGMAHGLELLIEAGERLRKDPDVDLVVVGEGARRQELLAEVQRRGLTNVHFVGMRPRAEMVDWIRGATAVLVHLKKSDVFETVYPSKIFEYMGCGKPILMGVAGAAGALVADARAGWLFTPDDVEEFLVLLDRTRKSAVEAEQLGRNGRAYAEKFYDRETLARKYVDDILRPLVMQREASK